MRLTFIGATNGVTGSKTLLEINDEKFLIDSGLYQEGENVSELNNEKLIFNPNELTAIIITHAHLDHTGYLPLLYKNGYRGPIYLTNITSKLTRIILQDSANLMSNQEKPLYEPKDALNVISLFKPQKFNEEFKHKNISIKFHEASHILGAAFVEINNGKNIITFSGDLGRYDDPLLGPPSPLNQTDYLIMESTYGNRKRQHKDMQGELQQLIKRAVDEKLTLLIPCFALHRSQLLTYLIKKIFKENPDLKIPLNLNSPMMENVTKVYQKFEDDFLPEKLELEETFSSLHFLDHYWDIDVINKFSGAQIILASSGMITGGRIWSHLLELAKKDNVLIFLPGYQAIGTPGYDLSQGKRNIISPEGIEVLVQAEIIFSEAFSSHADQDDLIKWVNSTQSQPKQIFLIHGEDEAKKALMELLKTQVAKVTIPLHNSSFDLS